ncbi:MAG: tetratricopeptide repeat protein [Verrucomicrobiales bacterium]
MKPKITTIIPIAALTVAMAGYFSAASGKRTSTESATAFASANRAVEEKDYPQAIEGYSDLIESGQYSASGYHNLALAHHRNGDIGRAVLNYERASRLDPRASDIQTNLEQAYKDGSITKAPRPRHQRMADSLSPNGWSAIAASGLFALGLLAVGRATRLIDWPVRAMRASAAVATAAIAIPAAALAVQHRADAGRAIVTGAGTHLRVSPFVLAQPVTDLAPGRTIRILPETHGSFHLAQLETGQHGWVEASDFETTNITTK